MILASEVSWKAVAKRSCKPYSYAQIETQNMRIIKLVLASYFLFLSVGSCCEALPSQQHNPSLPHWYYLSLRLTLIALTVIYALGAWSAWRTRASINLKWISWPLTASLMSVLVGFGIPAIAFCWGLRTNFWHSNRGFAVPAVLGIIGLIVFRRHRTPSEAVPAA